MNKSHLLTTTIVISLLGSLTFGCRGSQPKTLPGEPTGGNWRPILLESADAIRVDTFPSGKLIDKPRLMSCWNYKPSAPM